MNAMPELAIAAGRRTYGSVRLERDAWIIDRVEPHVAIRLKQIFQRIPKTGLPPYRLPHDPITCSDLEWFVSRYPLDIAPVDLRELAGGRQLFNDSQAELERILLPTYEGRKIGGIREGQEVRLYQVQAVDIMRRRRKLLLGDEGGLGKTYTATAFFCAEPDSMPAAVVCDAHMQKQWRDKIEAFSTLKVHIVKKGRPYNLPKADVYIFRITAIAGWVDIFASGFFKSVVYDEPQSLRTGEHTAKGKAAKVLSANTLYHLGLTATPIYNYGDEMWRIMQFIDDEVLGPWEDFAREWCEAIGNGKYHIKDPKALGTYLREHYALLRRLKGDVGLQLPKVSRIVEHVEYDSKAVQSIEELAHQLAIKATTGTFIERGNAARELDIMARQTTGVAKARSVARFVRLLVEAGEAVIVCGWHRAVYDIWNEELADLKPAMYTGSESASKKNREKTRFINGETDVMFMSLRSAAGTDGLQHRCNVVVIGELDWSPMIHQQIIWRVDREGQLHPVTAFFLVCDDGSDPPMMEVNGIKASEASQIVDPHLGVQTVVTDMSNLKRLVDRYLERRGRVVP